MSQSSLNNITSCKIPMNSFLSRYADGVGFADCYMIELQGAITQQMLVEAFYTTPLFKIERTILKILVAKPASNADAKSLSGGETDRFSAWHVEEQNTTELLLADFTGRTRSWLMAVPSKGYPLLPTTRLYFGSAVLPRRTGLGRKPTMGWAFFALLGFHRLYSRLLLLAASHRV